MDIRLSWDLFVIVFFTIILAFSFIVGRKQTIKILVAIYIAFLSSDAFGYFFGTTIGWNIPSKLFGTDPLLMGVLLKAVLFIFLIVVLSRHHAFDVQIEDEGYSLPYLASTAFVGFLSAALIVTIIFYFTSGNTLTLLVNNPGPNGLLFIRSQSELARKIIDFAHLWFFLPTFSLLALFFWRR